VPLLEDSSEEDSSGNSSSYTSMDTFICNISEEDSSGNSSSYTSTDTFIKTPPCTNSIPLYCLIFNAALYDILQR